MIIVTGANGLLGRGIVENLLRLVPASEVGVSVRKSEDAAALAVRGVRVRAGDFADAASLAGAFEGATKVLLISSNSSGDAAVEHHRNAIDAARAVGAQRIVYTSQMGSDAHSPFKPMPDHAATEALLAESGMAFTSLRNGFYTASGLMLLGDALETGELVAPADGPVAWTAHADLAEIAALALAGDGLDGITPPLTARATVDLAGIAAIAGKLSGKAIRRVVVGDDAFVARLVARGVPEARAGFMIGMFEAMRNGAFAALHPILESVLGRAPLSVGDVLAARMQG